MLFSVPLAFINRISMNILVDVHRNGIDGFHSIYTFNFTR